MSERTPERAWVADAIEKLAAAQARERLLEQAVERAAGIEQDASDAVEKAQRSGERLASAMKQAALAGDHAPVAVSDDVRHAAVTRSRLEAARAAVADLGADLEAAKATSLAAARSLDRATQAILISEARQLIAEALAAQQTVERIRVELYAIDRSGGSPGPSGEHQAFPFPPNGIALVRDMAAMSPGALASSGVNITPILARWQGFRRALRADPDAALAEA
jgi:hypothetical protein